MIKPIALVFVAGLFPVLVQAQSTSKDTLNLNRGFNTDGEIQLNKHAIRNIDFGTFVGEPKQANEKPWLDADVTLPKTSPEQARPVLTLRPYKPTTRYNYDPVYRKKIQVDKDTWKYGDRDAWKHGGTVNLKMDLIPSNWAKTPFDPGIRNSVEEIEATGLRYNPLANRANNIAVGAWQPAGGSGISGDFMAPFTKDFWDKKGRKRRARTLELLKHYGDSTTVQINEEIKKAVDR